MPRPNFLQVYNVATQTTSLVNLNNVFEIRMDKADSENAEEFNVVAEGSGISADHLGNEYVAQAILFSGSLESCNEYIQWFALNYDVVIDPKDTTQEDDNNRSYRGKFHDSEGKSDTNERYERMVRGEFQPSERTINA